MRIISKWCLCNRWIWSIIAASLLVVFGAFFDFGRSPDILKDSTEFSMPFAAGDVGLRPQWMAGGMFLLTHQTNHNVSAVLYDPVTRSRTLIPYVSSTLSKYAATNWTIYAHSSWVVLDSVSDSPFASFLFNINDSSAFTNSSNWRSWGNLFWMPTKIAWLRISGDKCKIEQMSGVREININKKFNPLFPIGFITNYVFISATNDLAGSTKSDFPYPKTLNLEYWHLDENPTLLATKKVYINGDYIIMGIVSQQGDRIIWICYHKMLFPRFAMSKELFAPRYDIRLYMSSNDVDGFRYIGLFPSITYSPHLQWLPDGTGIYFEYNKSWYIYHFGQK